mmetsp:Transcript_9575/g.35488  ORF Transcript_9575/g.35488 Transcript_9575/m.35488 type:complete len:230 (-) Transcript_9575:241-930(-)
MSTKNCCDRALTSPGAQRAAVSSLPSNAAKIHAFRRDSLAVDVSGCRSTAVQIYCIVSAQFLHLVSHVPHRGTIIPPFVTIQLQQEQVSVLVMPHTHSWSSFFTKMPSNLFSNNTLVHKNLAIFYQPKHSRHQLLKFKLAPILFSQISRKVLPILCDSKVDIACSMRISVDYLSIGYNLSKASSCRNVKKTQHLWQMSNSSELRFPRSFAFQDIQNVRDTLTNGVHLAL